MLAIFNALNLRPGDVLFRSLDGGAPFLHYGCFAGIDHFGRIWVFEHCEGTGSRLVLFEEFAKGYRVYFERIVDNERDAAIARMRSLLENPREYDVFGFNCEHATNFITKGLAFSLQVLIVVGLMGFGVYALAKNK